MTTLTQEEKVIVEILGTHNARSLETAISPKKLVQECAQKGVEDKAKIEGSIIQLIDTDIIEYEMDDQNQASHLWLLEE